MGNGVPVRQPWLGGQLITAYATFQPVIASMFNHAPGGGKVVVASPQRTNKRTRSTGVMSTASRRLRCMAACSSSYHNGNGNASYGRTTQRPNSYGAQNTRHPAWSPAMSVRSVPRVSVARLARWALLRECQRHGNSRHRLLCAGLYSRPLTSPRSRVMLSFGAAYSAPGNTLPHGAGFAINQLSAR